MTMVTKNFDKNPDTVGYIRHLEINNRPIFSCKWNILFAGNRRTNKITQYKAYQ